MKQLILIATILIGFSAITSAQRARLMDGSLDDLKGIKKLNVKYEYGNMDVGKKSEQEYIADKKEAYNHKEPGRGDKWEKEWISDRTRRFEPRLEEEFNKYSDIRLGHYPNEKYTLIFKTVFTEPGFNVVVSRKNAYIDGQVLIVENGNESKVIAKLEINNCPGRTFGGYDYDTGLRIQEAYAMAGKGLAKYFSKNIE